MSHNFLLNMYSNEIPLVEEYSATYFEKLLGGTVQPLRYPDPELDAAGIPYTKNRMVGPVNYGTGEVGYVDIENTYNRNSLGYRSEEFNIGIPLVIAGCSHTFGVGVPEDTIWGVQVANLLGLDYANLSGSGKSTYWIVQNLFSYFKKYGNPRTLLCYFPNFDRMVIPENREIMRVQGKQSSKKEATSALLEVVDGWTNYPQDRPKYSEKPHIAEDVLPVELAWMLNIQAVHALTQYCRAANIKFLWSTWAFDESDLVNYIKDMYDLPEFIDTYPQLWHTLESENYIESFHNNLDETKTCCNENRCSGAVNCHSDLKDQYGINFNRGTDSPSKPQFSHFGVHRQTHIAELFLERLNQN